MAETPLKSEMQGEASGRPLHLQPAEAMPEGMIAQQQVDGTETKGVRCARRQGVGTKEKASAEGVAAGEAQDALLVKGKEKGPLERTGEARSQRGERLTDVATEIVATAGLSMSLIAAGPLTEEGTPKRVAALPMGGNGRIERKAGERSFSKIGAGATGVEPASKVEEEPGAEAAAVRPLPTGGDNWFKAVAGSQVSAPIGVRAESVSADVWRGQQGSMEAAGGRNTGSVTTLIQESVAGPAANAQQDHRFVSATPSSLEVGIESAAHGWLTIRAEQTEAGVSASLLSPVGARAATLHHDLPALRAYLEGEGVPMASLAVHHVQASSSIEDGTRKQGQSGQQNVGGQSGGSGQREARRQEAEASFGLFGRRAGGAEVLAFAAGSPGSGGWLNVMA